MALWADGDDEAVIDWELQGRRDKYAMLSSCNRTTIAGKVIISNADECAIVLFNVD